ncbi:MAG TPA: DUF488 domain-containing protein [Allosphingosinicella sp.]|jgi:uncharacterized protein (DUF488 family)
MPLPVFTIGHSTRTIEQFVALLRAGGVEAVVDIRSVPRSRTNPQFNPDALAEALSPYQIGHTRIAELGGLRKKSAVPPVVNGFWTNRSFHNYADYALSEEFRAGLAALKGLAAERRCAIMCAEAVWWRCHRRIVADYLLAAGREVFHLMGDDRVERAKMTPAAVTAGDGLHYPEPGAGPLVTEPTSRKETP